ncbi:hypothetical protein [Deinococcus radiophilus]|uniref:Uncharacterized protein n=1 Tax=Deinococcus radiophilus TaxID=32062 RepID=A0A431VRS4_9DEIO|nr:hypothetical protein [Deinococcus radiophilus]RTR25896.1 hypothetical protein EJ104_09310 [Deinococcus radiophilus]UFA49686.1 hypothetical protein LMT64_07230 [Deinococcus radiophilus]
MTRIGQTLEELGITGKPEASLTHEGAFFVLVDDLLIYRDNRGMRRVSLRDLTRIHSDDQGVLKVETPAGTALSASLLGFDPDQVQPFFLRVRDATAYAKAQAKREQERQRGEAPPSPFARVPRAEPPHPEVAPKTDPTPNPLTARLPKLRRQTETSASQENAELYEPYERPEQQAFGGVGGLSMGERLGSVVRVIKRRSGETSSDQSETDPAVSPPAPADTRLVTRAEVRAERENLPEPALRPEPLRDGGAEPQPPTTPSQPPQGAHAPASVSMEEALRPQPVTESQERPEQNTAQAAPTEPALRRSIFPSLRRPIPSATPAEPAANVREVIEEAPRPAPKPTAQQTPTEPTRVAEEVQQLAVQPAPDTSPVSNTAGAEPTKPDAHTPRSRSASGGLQSLIRGQQRPDLQVWPPRLRLLALALTSLAAVMAIFSLLGGAGLAGLWSLLLALVLGAGLLVTADVLQRLAVWLDGQEHSGAQADAAENDIRQEVEPSGSP